MNVRISRVVVLTVLWGCGPSAPSSEPVVVPPEVESAAVWSVVPTSIRYDKQTQTVFVQAGVEVALNGSSPRDKEAYVGVTLAAEDGEEFDLAIQTVFPDQQDQLLMFSAGVEKPIQDVLIGLWDHKIEPCDSERPGCKTYGFLLDGSLASWPPNLYVDYKRQRILPERVTLLFTGPENVTVPWKDDVETYMREAVAMYGSSMVFQTSATATNSGLSVVFKHPKDEVLATALSNRIGSHQTESRVSIRQDESLMTDFVVRYGPLR